MRFSCNKDDAGYQNYLALKSSGVRVDVFVDGEEIKDVSTADDIAGCVIHDIRDEDGDFKMVNGEVVQWTSRGKVEIRISQPKPVEPETDVDGQ